MKTFMDYLVKTAILLLLAMITTTGIFAQTPLLPSSGTGTENNPYLIQTASDWYNLAEYVAAGNDCDGLYFQMTNNLGTTADPITMPLGRQVGKNKLTDRKRFAGHFDGDNHTLTIDINSNNTTQFKFNTGYCAPFAYAKGMTVKDLHVAGVITTTGQFASGLVGQSGPDNTPEDGSCTITNCHVSVVIYGNTVSSSQGNHGIFLSIAEGPATITNSWFDGELRGSNYIGSGGFIGLNKDAAALDNCLFNPNVISITNDNFSGSCEFVHENGGSHTLNNCYYTKSFSAPGNAQGTKVVTLADVPAGSSTQSVAAPDGNTYYIITGNAEWQAIQAAFTTNTDYQLTQDVIAGSNDEALVVPANSNVELDLNGYTLDRAYDLTAAQPSGYVIWVKPGATLTITDSGTNGTIRGGNNKNITSEGGNGGKGGGIYNEGTLIINGGTIADNRAQMGGGIYNAWDATLTMTSGVITGNYVAGDGGGIFCRRADGHNSTFNVSGNVQIYDNTKSNKQNNVYLEAGYVINIVGNLGNSSISLYMKTNGVFTSGLSSYGNISNFTSDKDEYAVARNNNEATLVSCISINVAGYGSGNDKWAFIASPVLADVNPDDVNGLKSNSYDLYRLNQSAAPLEWENYKNSTHQNNFVLENGKGYLYANNNNVLLKFAGSTNQNATETVNLDYDGNARLAGYNLVGNPFPVVAYVNKPYYKMNSAGDDVEAVSDLSTAIPICIGIIVVAEGSNETVTFSTSAPETIVNNGSVAMTLLKGDVSTRSEAEVQDKAIVSFSEGSRLGKFIFNEKHAKLYIPQDGNDYAIVSAKRNGEMPVSFVAKELGKYTISISGEDLNGIYLVDKIEGAVIDLSVNDSYTFVGAPSDRSDRFKLVFNATNNDFTNENFAYQSGNNIVVSGEGELQVFDVTGRMMFNTTINGVETINALENGVYIFRMIGNEVKTQKIVVR